MVYMCIIRNMAEEEDGVKRKEFKSDYHDCTCGRRIHQKGFAVHLQSKIHLKETARLKMEREEIMNTIESKGSLMTYVDISNRFTVQIARMRDLVEEVIHDNHLTEKERLALNLEMQDKMIKMLYYMNGEMKDVQVEFS